MSDFLSVLCIFRLMFQLYKDNILSTEILKIHLSISNGLNVWAQFFKTGFCAFVFGSSKEEKKTLNSGVCETYRRWIF